MLQYVSQDTAGAEPSRWKDGVVAEEYSFFANFVSPVGDFKRCLSSKKSFVETQLCILDNFGTGGGHGVAKFWWACDI